MGADDEGVGEGAPPTPRTGHTPPPTPPEDPGEGSDRALTGEGMTLTQAYEWWDKEDACPGEAQGEAPQAGTTEALDTGGEASDPPLAQWPSGVQPWQNLARSRGPKRMLLCMMKE